MVTKSGRPTKISVGDSFTNRSGEVCTVVDYISAQDVRISFEGHEDTIFSKSASRLREGVIGNPFSLTRFGVGFTGVGDYSTKSRLPSSQVIYTTWVSMLQRCYDTNVSDKNKTYAGLCVVSESWHNFQNFAIWLDTQFSLGHIGANYQLDKDLLGGGSLYSDSSCCLLPKEVNQFLSYSKSPPKALSKYSGVSRKRGRSSWVAQCNPPVSLYPNLPKGIGYYKTELEAAQAYKETKERYAKELAEHYKDQIDPRAYEALLKYEVIFPN